MGSSSKHNNIQLHSVTTCIVVQVQHSWSKLFPRTKANLFHIRVTAYFASSLWTPAEQVALPVVTPSSNQILRVSLKQDRNRIFGTGQIGTYFCLTCVTWSLSGPKSWNKFANEKHLSKRYLSEKMSESKSGGEKRKLENGETDTASQAAKKGKEEDFLASIAESRTAVCQSVAGFKFNKKRVRVLSKAQDFPDESQGVVYWMSRDQRVQGTIKFGHKKIAEITLKFEHGSITIE